MRRWILFLIVICIGLTGGLLYGWVVNPVKYVDTTLDSLRQDYKSDYVLMVAEAYSAEKNLPLAVQRLTAINTGQPEENVKQALLFAKKLGYSDDDIELIQQLLEAMKALPPISGTVSP